MKANIDIKKEAKRVVFGLAGAIIMAVNIKTFVRAGGLYPGGFNGVTLLIQTVFQRFLGIALPFTLVNLLLNAVPTIVCFKAIGKKFTVSSAMIIVLTSILTDIIPSQPITQDILLIAVFGGLINGFAVSLCWKIGLISVGWDPGMFSLNRLYANAILPEGTDYTFWGKGVSQGHSDAVRRIEGVVDARQYTIPVEKALTAVRNGENPTLTTGEKHTREVFVVAEEGADREKIEKEIKTMPNYFDEYETTVHFISEEQMKAEHAGLPHGGFVIRTGKTGWEKEHSHVIEYSLKLDSNPEFTSSVIVAYARAAYRLNREGQSGCRTVFDIAPAYLTVKSPEELRKHML